VPNTSKAKTRDEPPLSYLNSRASGVPSIEPFLLDSLMRSRMEDNNDKLHDSWLPLVVTTILRNHAQCGDNYLDTWVKNENEKDTNRDAIHGEMCGVGKMSRTSQTE